MSDNKINSDHPELNPGSQQVPDNSISYKKPWSWSKKLIFRILFIFFLAMSIPVTGSWYTNVFTINWFRPHYRDIYDIARFSPSYRALFGGKNEYDVTDAPGGDEPGSDGNKANRKQGGSDTASAANGNTGRHHHHTADSVQTNNAADTGRHHHHRKDSALIAGQGATGGGEHHHHKNDSTNTDSGKTLIAANGSSPKHHADSTGVDSTAHDSTKIASAGGNHHRNKAKQDDSAPAPKKNFLVDYTDWGIALLIGIIGGLIWTLIDRNRTKAYDILYYWIRVVVRYRAGIGIIGFGFTKLFPTQMPYPSMGLLNSNFGDFTAQKIYWMSVGIVPWYQVFGGVVEILAGGMLFFRKTSTFGAILLVGALGDITFVNYAYDGGVHVYAFYFVLLGLFVLADDLPKLYNLLILERFTVPVRLYPDFSKPWLKYTRITLKALTFIIFFGILTYTEVINFKYDPYKQPSTAGVRQLRGNYHVTEFKINGQDIPYNPLDSTRWQEATFENWTTLTFRVNRPVVIDLSNGGGSPMHDIQRTFEITGVAGGERAFHYLADTVDHVLYLQDKNVMALRGSRKRGGNKAANDKKPADNWISKTALQHIGDEKKLIDPHAWSTRRDREFAAKTKEPRRSRMILQYQTTDGNRVILSGVNETKDSIYVVLDRYNKKYTLPASTLVAGKY